MTRSGPRAGSALQLSVIRREEMGSLVEELVEGWRPCQQHMIVSRQLDEARARDEPSHVAALLERCHAVALAVKHQSGDPHLFRQLGRLHLGVHLPKP
jgi:hypothetical protein